MVVICALFVYQMFRGVKHCVLYPFNFMKMSIVYKGKDADVITVCRLSLGHVINIPTMQFHWNFQQ